MAKLIVTYEKPRNIEGFEEYYFNTHVPLVHQLPNVVSASVDRVIQAQNTDLSPYLIAQIEFDSIERLNEALGSEAGKAVVEDANNLATFLNSPPMITITLRN